MIEFGKARVFLKAAGAGAEKSAPRGASGSGGVRERERRRAGYS
jgi:hypothetical protein